MSQNTIFHLHFVDIANFNFGIVFEIGTIAVILIIFLSFLFSIKLYAAIKNMFAEYELIEADIGISSIGHVKFKKNPEVKRIAHQAWVELQTRKAALPFDEENDLINEVYDSWYALFGEFRKLLKTIPSEKISSNEDVEQLVDTMVAVLNDGIRPHLTKWQGRFRKWLSTRKDEVDPLEPQLLQRKFSGYEELVVELKSVNEVLGQYSALLKKLSR